MSRAPALALALVLFLALFLAPAAGAAESPAAGSGAVWVIELADSVNPGTAEFLRQGLELAAEADAACVILKLDTPGGLVDSMRDMVRRMLASPVPVVVYVAPAGARAASAGAFLVLAGGVAAMAPATNVGAAHPVGAGGKDIEGEMAKKALNDLTALIVSLAKRRGRDGDLARRMVTESLSLDAIEAQKKGLVDLISRDLGHLLTQLHGREVPVAGGVRKLTTAGRTLHFHTPGVRERLLSLLANPSLAYILMMIGMMGLYFELSHPGGIFPGVVGGISLILALFAMSTLPVSYTGLALIGLSLVLFIAEIKIVSHGLLSLGGAASLVLGSVMLFDNPGQFTRLSLGLILPTAGGVTAFFLGVTYLAMRAQLGRPTTGGEGLVGQTALVLDPGRVRVMGEIWKARAASPLSPGQKVVVREIKGLELTVEPAPKEK